MSKREKIQSKTKPGKYCTPSPKEASKICPKAPAEKMKQESIPSHNTASSACNKASQPGKSEKEGPTTRNPFLNYLRHYRKAHRGLSMVQIVEEGGKSWNAMTDQDKWPYIVEAFRARKRRRSSSHINVGKRKRKSRSSSSVPSYIN